MFRIARIERGWASSASMRRNPVGTTCTVDLTGTLGETRSIRDDRLAAVTAEAGSEPANPEKTLR
jgi:hypothetical protein